MTHSPPFSAIPNEPGFDAWWAGLSGHSPPDMDVEYRQGAWMRALLHQHEQQQDKEETLIENILTPEQQARCEQQWLSTRQKLRGMLALSAGVSPSLQGFKKPATNQHWYALAAAVVLVLGAVLWQQPKPYDIAAGEDGVVMRGDEQAQIIKTADPEKLAQQTMRILQQHGLKARKMERAQGIQIQAKVPLNALDARKALVDLGIQVPQHERLNIEINGMHIEHFN